MQNLNHWLQDTFTLLAQTQTHALKLVGPHRLALAAVRQLNTLFCARENIQPKHAHNRRGQ